MSMSLEATGAILRAQVSLSSTGGEIVAAVTGKRIRVLAVFLTVQTASGTVKFTSGTGGDVNDITPAMIFAANGQLSMPFNPAGWFETDSGENLSAVLASAGNVTGVITYQLV